MTPLTKARFTTTDRDWCSQLLLCNFHFLTSFVYARDSYICSLCIHAYVLTSAYYTIV